MSFNFTGLFKFAESNLNTLVKINAAAAKVSEQLVKHYADVVNVSLESTLAASKRLAEVKSPVELFQLQTNLAKTSIEKLAQETKKTAGLTFAAAKEVAEPLKERFQPRSNVVAEAASEVQAAA